MIKRFALEDLKSGKLLSGKDGILTPLVKRLTEAALEAELGYRLNNDNNGESNRRKRCIGFIYLRDLRGPTSGYQY